MGAFTQRLELRIARATNKKGLGITSCPVKTVVKLTRDRVHILPRVEELRSLAGWYSFHGMINWVEPIARLLHGTLGEEEATASIHSGYIASMRGIRLGKYLSQFAETHKGFSNDEVSVFMNRYTSQGKFKLSVQYNDLLRCSEGKHFGSCFDVDSEWGWRGVQPVRDLADPDVAIIYFPDKAGKFMSRCFCRLLVREDGQKVLGLYRMYGNGLTHPAIASALKGKIECMALDSSYGENMQSWVERKSEVLRAFSTSWVPCVHTPVWCDHGRKFDQQIRKVSFTGRSIERQSGFLDLEGDQVAAWNDGHRQRMARLAGLQMAN